MNWNEYVHDIVTFRAHDWWGLFVSMAIELYLLYSLYSKFYTIFWLIFIIFILNFGVFIDINAHKIYH